MSTQRLYTITLIIAYFLKSGFSLYLNETVVVNLDITIITQSQLNISENDIQTVIATSFISANNANSIIIDNIQFASNFHFFNEYDEYEYMAVFEVYFQSQNAYDDAINNGYTKYIYNSLSQFITHFEGTMELNLSPIQPDVLINSMKIIQFQIKSTLGTLMIHYKGEVTTTTDPTSFTMTPSRQPTATPSTSPTPNPSLPPSDPQPLSSSNYAFKQESTYWVLIFVFLFVGCCIGCCCVYGVNYVLQIRADEEDKEKTLDEVRAYSATAQKPDVQPIKSPSKRNTNGIQMTSPEKQKKPGKKRSKKRKKKRSATAENVAAANANLSEEQLKKKRERYIEYGSDDESEQDEVFADPVKKTAPQTRTRPQSEIMVITTKGMSSDDGSVEEIMSKTRGGDTPTATGAGTEDSAKSPRSRLKNTATGTVEPDRYDFDGNRKLTTKELLNLYKKKRQRGGDSVDLSYKISKKGRGREEKEGDGSSGSEDSEGNEYEFERDNYSERVQVHKLSKGDESGRGKKRRRGRDKKRHSRRKTGDYNSGKKRRHLGKHTRSQTGTLTNSKKGRRHRSRSQGKNKLKKYVRPKSARHIVNNANSSKKRPKSARQRAVQMNAGGHGGHGGQSFAKSKTERIKAKSKDSDSDSDEDDGNEYTPEPKEVHRDDYDDESSDY